MSEFLLKISFLLKMVPLILLHYNLICIRQKKESFFLLNKENAKYQRRLQNHKNVSATCQMLRQLHIIYLDWFLKWYIYYMYVMQYELKSYKNISIIPFIFEIENEEIPNDLYAIALILKRRKNSGPNTVALYHHLFWDLSQTLFSATKLYFSNEV